MGLVFVAFGANYTNLLIYLLLGNKWGETAAPSVLSWYCLYVLMMGINGITEGGAGLVWSSIGAGDADIAELGV